MSAFSFITLEEWSEREYNESRGAELICALKHLGIGVFELLLFPAMRASLEWELSGDRANKVLDAVYRIKCAALGFEDQRIDHSEGHSGYPNYKEAISSMAYEGCYILTELAMRNDKPIHWPFSCLFLGAAPFLLSDKPEELIVQLKYGLRGTVSSMVKFFEDRTIYKFPWGDAVDDAIQMFRECYGTDKSSKLRERFLMLKRVAYDNEDLVASFSFVPNNASEHLVADFSSQED